MKQYLIDGLRPTDHQRIKRYLDRHVEAAGISGIYWLPVEKHLLTQRQARHYACAPHVFALKLDPHSLACEFLVRTKKNVQCDCMGYATHEQRHWLMETADAILDTLSIRI